MTITLKVEDKLTVSGCTSPQVQQTISVENLKNKTEWEYLKKFIESLSLQVNS